MDLFKQISEQIEQEKNRKLFYLAIQYRRHLFDTNRGILRRDSRPESCLKEKMARKTGGLNLPKIRRI